MSEVQTDSAETQDLLDRVARGDAVGCPRLSLS
jgi:hypothetical protein